MILKKGEQINDTYDVQFFIGQGAFGEVYRVKHKFFNKLQVMKVFKSDYVEKADLKEIVNEGEILTHLSHPNVVKVYEINTFMKDNQTFYFITMSFVSGESLAQLMKRKIQLDIPVATSILIDVLRGLTAAHKNNPTIVHRDISPDNILLSYEDHRPIGVLGDFGIATLLNQVNEIPGANGKFFYFAPECFMNLNLPTSDVFAAGIVLYKILTGGHPWEYDFDSYDLKDNDDVSKMIGTGRKGSPIKPSIFNPDIEQRLENIIMKALEKNMENRYRTATEFLKALESTLQMEDFSQGYWVKQNLVSVN